MIFSPFSLASSYYYLDFVCIEKKYFCIIPTKKIFCYGLELVLIIDQRQYILIYLSVCRFFYMREDGTKKLKSKGVYFISPDADTFFEQKSVCAKVENQVKRNPCIP